MRGGFAPRVDVLPRWLVPRRYATEETARKERARLSAVLAPLLDEVAEGRDLRASLEADPVRFVHRFERPEDKELIGLLASSLSYGHVTVIRASIEKVLAVLGRRPASTLASMRGGELARELSAFVHRFTKGADVAALLFAASRCQIEHGGLGRLFSICLAAGGGDLRQAVFRFVSAIRDIDMRPVRGRREPPAGMAYLLPDGTGPGACKRLHMYLRWMVRGPDGVDLGLWSDLSPSILLMPLDTHTGRICRYIGLTRRRDLSWRTTEEVTWHLRGIDPDDPVRYDFALAHLGISRRCPHRAGAEGCERCALGTVCRA